MKGHIGERDYIRAMKRASRELEIELHGKQITTAAGRKIHRSDKAYKRSRFDYSEIDY